MMDLDTVITRQEHEEFARRMETENQRLKDEDSRQNKRLDLLEENAREISALATSMEKLATNMEGMVKVQEQQGKRLETLESRDGELWRKAKWCILSALIGGGVTALLTMILH